MEFQARVASRKDTSSLVAESTIVQVHWNVISENGTIEGGDIPLVIWLQ